MNRRVELLTEPERTEIDPTDEQNARNTLHTCAALEDMFDSAGWTWITEALNDREARLVRSLEGGAHDMEAVYKTRAQLELVRWFLALPQMTAQDRALASELLQEEA